MLNAEGCSDQGPTTSVPVEFLKGEQFVKVGNKSTTGGDVDYPARVCLDPAAHILYWRRLSRGKEISVRHVFVDEIVDVRCGQYAEPVEAVEKRPDLVDHLLTVVLNKDFTHPVFHTFVHKSRTVVSEWAAFLVRLAFKRRREHHGPWFYVQKMLAPLRFAALEDVIHMEKIVDLLVPDLQTVDKMKLEILLVKYATNGQMSISRQDLTDSMCYDICVALTGRRELQKIFRAVAGEHEKVISVARLARFLNVRQRDPRQNELIYPYATTQQVERLIREFSTQDAGLSYGGFVRFLLSDECSDLDARDFALDEHNMHHPLPFYYISCSHNTYLTGAQINQAKYFSSIQHDRTAVDVEIYRQVLLSGCRCIELDCWDGSDGEPVITHGPTEVTQLNTVLFKDVLLAIAECAFKTSDYPVMLSIENHCSPVQQRRMAQLFISIFGDNLLAAPLPEYPLEKGVQLPSPFELKRKILIKAKKKINGKSSTVNGPFDSPSRKTSLTSMASGGTPRMSYIKTIMLTSVNAIQTANLSTGGSTRSVGLMHRESLRGMCDDAPEELIAFKKDESNQNPPTSTSAKIEATLQKIVQHVPSFSKTRPPDNAASATDQQEEGMRANSVGRMPLRAHVSVSSETSSVAVELSDLVNYLQGRSASELKFGDESDREFFIMHSISEDMVSRMVSDSQTAQLLSRHTVRQLARVFPSGIRYASSNFNPLYCWMVGCQMAAMNYQTNGLAMHLNETLFADNGGCGYVLKPKCLWDLSISMNPYLGELPSVMPDALQITVISGQFLNLLHPNRPIPSTYVMVDLYDLPLDTVRNKCRTRTIRRNGLNPIYRDEDKDADTSTTFRFPKVIKPEGAYLHIRVMDSDAPGGDLEIGHRILPVHKMKKGYRHIILRNGAGRATGPSSVFVYINVRFFAFSSQIDLNKAFEDPIKATVKMEQISLDLSDPFGSTLRRQQSVGDDYIESESDEEIVGFENGGTHGRHGTLARYVSQHGGQRADSSSRSPSSSTAARSGSVAKFINRTIRKIIPNRRAANS